MTNKLYPIKFEAQPRTRVWGGNNLINKLNKTFLPDKYQIAPTEKIGESWEIFSLCGESSNISNGFLAENTLDDFIETYMGDALGDKIFQYYRGEFPLLIKLLDIQDKLSVQVHPNDEIAFEREDCFGKAECWYILDACENAKIYMGFNKDLTASELYERAKTGNIEEVLNVITPKKGDCFYIEPGTVHAAGGGILIAEIQQSSDITYRIYDWGREYNPKTARRMHIEDAIDIINYKKYQAPKYHIHSSNTEKEELLCTNSNFVIKKLKIDNNKRIYPSLYNSFIIYIAIDGEIEIKTNDNKTYNILAGESLLIPAGMDDFLINSKTKEAHLLEVYIPAPTEEHDNYINENAPDLDDIENSPIQNFFNKSNHTHTHNCGCKDHKHN